MKTITDEQILRVLQNHSYHENGKIIIDLADKNSIIPRIRQLFVLSQPVISIDWEKIIRMFDTFSVRYLDNMEKPVSAINRRDYISLINEIKSNIGEQKKEINAVDFLKWTKKNTYLSITETPESLYQIFLKQKEK